MSSAPTKSLQSGAGKNKMRKASAALFRLPKPLQMPFVCHELHPTLFDIPMRWKPQRELMVRALKNQNAAPTTPPCFGRRPRSSSLLFKSWRPSERHPTLFDIPMRWDPRTKQQPTGLLFALPSAVPCCSSPGWQQKRAPIGVLFFVMGQPGLEPGTKRL